MDMMILGETIKGQSPDVYYGFWMPSGGNDCTGGVEVFVVSATSKFTLKLQTKNSEDVDPASGSGIIGTQSINAGAPAIFRLNATGAKEWVRYIITADDMSTDQYMHFQLLQPQWIPN